MSVYPTVKKFPVDSVLKDKTGFPWGCVIQPLCTPSSQDEPEPVDSR